MLSVRASNCLESENIMTVRDLVRRSEDQLLEVRNFGETTLTEVKDKLRELGLHLGHAAAVDGRQRRLVSKDITIHLNIYRHQGAVPPCDIDEKAGSSAAVPVISGPCLKSLASALFLTERDAEFDDNKPKIKGRIITTISKAKEVRPLVEKCITLACKAHVAADAAGEFGTTAGRGSDEWKKWRKSDRWSKWNAAIAPSVAARRRCLHADRRQAGDARAVPRNCPAICRSAGRLHPHRAARQAAARRRRHAGHARIGRRPRSRDRTQRPPNLRRRSWAGQGRTGRRQVAAARAAGRLLASCIPH